MENTRIDKTAKVAALRKLLEEVELRARHLGIPFDRSCLPGRKRDLYIVARRRCPELIKASEGSLEEYMREICCKFPPTSRVTGNVHHDAYRNLFPEYFSGVFRETDL